MPVPDTYSRRYGSYREESSYPSYSSRTAGRSSYLSSYSSSKLNSSLPPRAPSLYEHRKLTEASTSTSTSRFLSSSTSRTRDYGTASSYRSSVSPVRATSSYRRTLDTSISDRLKAIDMGEKDLVSKYSTRSRDSSLTKSSYLSSYRERSASRDIAGSPVSSLPPSATSRDRADSLKSSEAIRSRSSSSGSNAAVSRSAGRNGVSRLTSEVNNSSESESTSSASKGVTTNNTTTTTISATSATAAIKDDVDKCSRDLENNDADSLESSSSSVSVTNTEEILTSINSMNGNDENNTKAIAGSQIKRVKSGSSVLSKSQSQATVADKDNNGNPISMEIKDNYSVAGQRVSKESSSGQSQLTCSSTRAKDNNSLSRKCESDKNANVVAENSKISSSASGGYLSSKDSVVNKPRSSGVLNSSLSSRSASKTIYHTFRVEDREPSPPTESVKISVPSSKLLSATTAPSASSYSSSTSGSNNSSSSLAAAAELNNTSKKSSVALNDKYSNETSVEFNIPLPRVRKASVPTSSTSSSMSSAPSPHASSSTTSTTSEQRHSNTSSASSSSARYGSEERDDKIKLINNKDKSPTPDKGIGMSKSKTLPSSKRESTPEAKEVTKTSRNFEGVRKSPPVEQVIVSANKGRSPSPANTNITSASNSVGVSSPKRNGDSTTANVNSDTMGGPHSSKFAYTSSGSYLESANKNDGVRERDRERLGGRSRLHGYSNTSDSSDNDSDAYSSSPQTGRFRSKEINERAGLTGLRNIGNTCFMNSVLQCLSNTKPLLEYVQKDNYTSEINTSTSGMKGLLMRAFGELIQELWRESRVVDTSAFKDQIQRFAPRFMGYSQQDAQEFLRYLLEGLHEDVNRVTAKPKPILTDIDDDLSDSQKAAEAWKRYLRYDDSRIVDIFVGQLKSTLKCTTCGHCSVTFDPFWDLSLSIPSKSSQIKMSQCFELFTREEVLDGDEKPTCAKCQCRRKCTKSLSIQKFPKILVIHLKRFSPTERYRGKLSTSVDFPLNGLDLSQFAANRGQGCSYNLYGMANHSGSTYSGHYIAYCKHPYSGEWNCYNDSRVSPISSHSVVSSEGYVLFYEHAGQSSQL